MLDKTTLANRPWLQTEQNVLRIFSVIFNVFVTAPMLWLLFIYPWVS